MTQPRNGPCSPWINGDDVRSQPSISKAITKLGAAAPSSEDVLRICARAASASSTILYRLSGRVFTGPCGPVTIRPVARPADVDTRFWLSNNMGWGYSISWGACNYYGLGVGGVATHFGCSNPSEIEFGEYPITSIESVYIDGILIPTNEYEVRDHKTLVRLRTSASEIPTARWGWPTCQIPDIPLTEQGTFGVTYNYGQEVDEGGKLAALKFAEVLALPSLGDTTSYPTRVTAISRQGVSAQVASVIDVVKDHGLGIYEVDAWLLAVNPTKAKRQAKVWSPDLGRNRRVPTPFL
jgi:hypothetical protein